VQPPSAPEADHDTSRHAQQEEDESNHALRIMPTQNPVRSGADPDKCYAAGSHRNRSEKRGHPNLSLARGTFLYRTQKHLTRHKISCGEP
jgi:hypothetical protein